MRRTLLVLLVGPLLLLVAPAPFEPVADRTAAAQAPAEGGLMAVARPPRPALYPAINSMGWVTAVDARSITVHRVRFNRGLNQPVVRFTASEELAAGQVTALWSHYPPYPLADVRVGDLVYVTHGPIDGVNECYEINILRRPGGRLGPPSVFAPTYKKSRYNLGFPRAYPYHEWINAIQDFEERGIRIPPRLLANAAFSLPGPGRLCPDGTIEPPRYAKELVETRPGGGGYPLWDGTLYSIPPPREVSPRP